MATVVWQSLTGAAAELLPQLVVWSIKASLLLLVAAAITLAMRRSSAARRHAVWLAAIVGLLILPVASRWLPALRLLPQFAPTTSVVDSQTPPHAQRNANDRSHATVTDNQATSAPSPTMNDSRRSAPSQSAASAASELAPRDDVDRSSAASWQAWPGWPPLLVAIWLSGTVIFLARIVVSCRLLQRLAAASEVVHEGPIWKLHQLLCTKLETGRVRLLLGDRDTPMAWGIVWRSVYLPKAATNWSDERLHAVLTHELGHIQRLDPLSQWLVQWAVAAHWFNPMVWLAAWRMRVERERACDDLVLENGVAADRYAEHLLRIVSGFETRGLASGIGLAMASGSRLESRLRALLSANADRRRVTRRAAAVVTLLALLIAVPMAMLTAQDLPPAPGTPHQPPTFDVSYLDEALQYARRIQDEKQRSEAMYLLAYALSRAGRLDEAWEAASQVLDPRNRIHAFAGIAEQAHEESREPLMLDALSTARQVALDKRQETHNDMIRLHVRLGQRRAMEEYAAALNSEPLRDRVYEEIAAGHAAIGEREQAHWVVSSRVPDHRRDVTYKEMAQAAAFAGLFADAEAIAARMLSGINQDHVRNYIVSMYVSQKRLDDARRLAAIIEDVRVRGFAMRNIIDAEDVDGSELERRIAAAFWREERLPLLEKLFQVRMSESQIEAAELVLERMVEEIRQNPRPGMISFLGGPRGPWEENDSTITAEIRARCYAQTAAAWQRAGNIAAARERLTIIEQSLETIPAGAPQARDQVLVQLVRTQVLLGELEAAKSLVHQALEEDEAQSAAGPLLVTAAVEALIETGRAEEAIAMVTQAQHRLRILPVLDALIAADDVDRAIQWLSAYPADALDYRRFAAAMMQAGRGDELRARLADLPSDAARAHVLIGAGFEAPRLTPPDAAAQ